MSQQQNPLERAVDLFVFAPVGVAMFAKDTVPTFLKMFVSRGQTEMQHRKKLLHDQANQYRAVGKFAVKYGAPEVKRQAEGKLDGARRLAEETFSGLVVARNGGGADEPGETVDAKNGNGTNGRTAKRSAAPTYTRTPHVAPALAIHEYDQLSASQVVERLDGLTPGELDAVREYEQAHRGRSTIIGKITQLTS